LGWITGAADSGTTESDTSRQKCQNGTSKLDRNWHFRIQHDNSTKETKMRATHRGERERERERERGEVKPDIERKVRKDK
jgi:hypothetical protein